MSYEFPKGLTVKTVPGGSNTLKSTLLDLRKYSFSGYVKTALVQVGTISIGYIVIKEGIPLLSIYMKGEEKEYGRNALAKIWKETYNEKCTIEVHSKVDLEEIAANLGDEARIEREEAPRPAAKPEEKAAPPSIKPGEKPALSPVKPDLQVIPPSGPPLKPVVRAAKPSPPSKEKVVIRPFKPKEKVATPPAKRVEAVAPPARREEAVIPPQKPTEPAGEEERLKHFLFGAREAEAEKKEAVVPEKEPLVEEGRPDETARMRSALDEWSGRGYKVDALRKAIDESPETAEEAFKKFEESVKKMEVLRTILQSLNTDGFEERAEAIRAKLTNPELLLAAEADIELLRETIEKRMKLGKELPIPRKKVEAPSADIEERTNLILSYAFDNFVVGESNRFPWGAAFSVAKSVATKAPSTTYNPLFIWSGAGLGKTHLLNAIGNYIVGKNPDVKGYYISAERFETEFGEAANAEKLAEFRSKYRNLDFILIDDVHFLAGNEKAQEELFHTFNELYNANKQIALASDRPPREIPAIQDRLISRFESGLVADIQMPEFETRMGILTKRCEETNIKVDDEVLKFIANIVMDNIRELGGALNKVVAYSRLMNRTLNVELAKEVLKELVKEEVVKVEPKKVSKSLLPGGSYLGEEDKPERCFEIFIKGIIDGYEPLLITRMNPKRIRSRYDLGKGRILWLTDKESGTEETVPPVLERIISMIEEFLKGKRGILLIDGLEYLISMNSFDAVIRFLRRIIDEVSETESTFLLSVSPKTMKEWEIKTLEKEMEVLDIGEADSSSL